MIIYFTNLPVIILAISPDRTIVNRVTGRRQGMKQIVMIIIAAAMMMGVVQADPDGPEDVVHTVKLAAAGRQTTEFTIKTPGRFAVTADSMHGTAIRIVDRVSGPGPLFGEPGVSDGRADRFFEPGEYRIITRGHLAATGNVTVTVRPFRELRSRLPLPPGTTAATDLDDFQYRSWRLDIRKPHFVHLEAAGRHLSDMRIWLPGGWLHQAVPESDIILKTSGQPLRHLTLSVRLDPGVYTLALYGGPGPVWSRDDSTAPLFIRCGIPSLPAAARREMIAGPFGIERFRIQKGASYYQLELPEALPAELNVGTWSDDPFSNSGRHDSITQKSRRPVADIRYLSSSRETLVSVRTEPGQHFTLQVFPEFRQRKFQGGGACLLQTFHTGDPRDSIDATLIITQSQKDRVSQDQIFQALALNPGPGKIWHRRFNLTGTATVFLYLEKPGEYRFEARGTPAHYRVEPFILHRTREYQPPSFTSFGTTWDLDAGTHILTIEPIEKGIIETAFFPAETAIFSFEDKSPPPGLTLIPLQPRCIINKLEFQSNRHYEIWLNAQPDVITGLEKTYLDANGQPRYPSKSPKTSQATLPEIASYPDLTPEKPAHLDLNRRQSRIYSLKPGAPGLYRLRSTGLLALEGRIRTRTDPHIQQNAQNGTGRNFLIQRYFGPGQYQLTVTAMGGSRGHLGLKIERTQLLSGGSLEDGLIGRATLAPDQGILYTFTVNETGEYLIDSHGTSSRSRCRLEDSQGWPVTVPGRNADFQIELIPDTYRLIILPSDTRSRRLTTVTRIRETAFTGPGNLVPDKPHKALWREPEPGAPRTPDQWTFTIPAPVDATLTLSAEMTGTLARLNPETRQEIESWTLIPGKPWSGQLLPGEYRAEILSRHINDHAPYEITVTTDQLVSGGLREITVPAMIPVSVGGSGQPEMIRIGSSGRNDVRAVLLDAAGKTIATENDRPDDWNFLICQPLPPGRYTLVVNPVNGPSTGYNQFAESVTPTVNGPSANCTVFMESVTTRIKNVRQPGRFELYPEKDRVTLAIPVPDPAQMITIQVESRENLLLTADQADGTGQFTRTGKHLRCDLPADPGTEVRVELISLDRRRVPATVTVTASSPDVYTETDLMEGIPPAKSGKPDLIAIKLNSPGIFHLNSPAAGDTVFYSDRIHSPCRPADRGIITAATSRIWLVRTGPATIIKGSRIRLADDDPTGVTVYLHGADPVFCDLEPADGPVIVRGESREIPVGIQVIPRSRIPDFHPDATAMALSNGTAVAVLPVTEPAVTAVWNTGIGSKIATSARLTLIPCHLPIMEETGFGLIRNTLTNRQPRIYKLPAGPKRITLNLNRDMVAVLSHGTSPGSIHWRDEPVYTETVITGASRIALYPMTAGPAGYDLTVFPLTGSGPVPVLSPSQALDMYLPSPGVLNVHVKHTHPGESSRLFLAGQVESAVFHSNSGGIRTGLNTTLDSGLLKIRHTGGYLAGWLHRQGTAPYPAPGTVPDKILTASLPARLSLSGKSQRIQIRESGPRVLTVTVECPAIVVLDGPGNPAGHVLTAGGTASLFLPGGRATLHVRSPAGGTLFGGLEITGSEMKPVPDVEDPAVILAPGSMAAFTFTLPRSGTVGIGIRTSSADIHSRLLDAEGSLLSEGISMMPALNSGVFTLVITLPHHCPPAEILPVITGLNPPPTGPPERVVRQYLPRASWEINQ